MKLLIKSALMLILSIHLTTIATTTISANSTITSNNNSKTQILPISANASTPLPTIQESKIKSNQQKIKLTKDGERVLNRGIAPTGLNSINSNTSIVSVNEIKTKETAKPVTIVTEGSGVSKFNLKNDNLTIALAEQKANSTKLVTLNTTTTTRPPVVANATSIRKQETKPESLVPAPVKLSQNVTAPTTSTSTTTSTTTTTTTTTTPKPKKPKVTYSVEDMPDLAKIIPVVVPSSSSSNNNKFPSETKSSAPKLTVDEPEIPRVQPSLEFDSRGLYRSHRDYIIPIVSIIFAVPIFMGMVIVAYRRFRDFWSTRHYRRMDFLVDGMYND